MSIRNLIILMTVAAIAPQQSFAVDLDDAEEIEEIVIRKKKIVKPQSNFPGQGNLLVQEGSPAGNAVEDLPPPEPPPSEAAEPKRLVRYFCKMWKDEEWEKMWWSMTPQYRKKVSLKKFTALFIDDAETNGGLSDENIAGESETNAGIGVKVELVFKFKRAKHRVVRAEVQRVPGGQYRLVESAIIPADLNDL